MKKYYLGIIFVLCAIMATAQVQRAYLLEDGRIGIDTLHNLQPRLQFRTNNFQQMDGFPKKARANKTFKNFRNVSLADINGDQKQDILWGADNQLFAQSDQELLWQRAMSGTLIYPPSIADLNQDGALDIVQATGGSQTASRIYLLDTAGQNQTGWPLNFDGNWIITAPALADVDDNGQLDGFKIMEIGRLALNNEAFQDAIKIFDYLVEKYNDKPVYSISRRMLIMAKEQLVKNTYPVDMSKIKSLALDYNQIVKELGVNRNTADAIRRMALLQAFYLNNKDTAISILQSLIKIRGMKQSLISEAKLDLGDIYLLKGDPWEASLLYSQVEKAEKDQNLGHIAKLKNAKLSYYKGEFELARAHLDVLKLATSREIANDAMDLSLLIQDNLDLDTTAKVMEDFAEIDLLVFQSKFQEALERYENLTKKNKDHSLVDLEY